MPASGNAIKRLRTERGWSQMALAQASGLSLPTVQRAEHDRGSMTLGTAIKLARALEVESSTFYIEAPASLPPPALATIPARLDAIDNKLVVLEEIAPSLPDQLAAINAKLDAIIEACNPSDN